jgi:hypothetical protein
MLAEPPKELVAALGAFTILSPAAFSFGGEPPIDVRMTPYAFGWISSAPASGEPADQLVMAIQATLYERCYARGLSGPEAQPRPPDRGRS